MHGGGGEVKANLFNEGSMGWIVYIAVVWTDGPERFDLDRRQTPQALRLAGPRHLISRELNCWLGGGWTRRLNRGQGGTHLLHKTASSNSVKEVWQHSRQVPEDYQNRLKVAR